MRSPQRSGGLPPVSAPDDGLAGRPDGYRTNYLDLRARIQPSSTQEWSITSGITRSHLGSGFEKRVGDPPRTEIANRPPSRRVTGRLSTPGRSGA